MTEQHLAGPAADAPESRMPLLVSIVDSSDDAIFSKSRRRGDKGRCGDEMAVDGVARLSVMKVPPRSVRSRPLRILPGRRSAGTRKPSSRWRAASRESTR